MGPSQAECDLCFNATHSHCCTFQTQTGSLFTQNSHCFFTSSTLFIPSFCDLAFLTSTPQPRIFFLMTAGV